MGVNPTHAIADIERRRGHSWPFMSAPTPGLADSVPMRQEIEFKDGSRIWLTRVMKSGSPCLFVRELGEPAAGARVDLRQFIPGCEKELPTTSTRDVAGFIYYGLRGQFATRDQFLEAATTNGRPE